MLVEQLVAPVERRSQRALTFRSIARLCGQDVEAIAEALQESIRRHDSRARRGQLYCQRETVESSAQFGHCRRVLGFEPERRYDCGRTIDEQSDRRLVTEHTDRRRRVGASERRYRTLVLRADTERVPARGKDLHARRPLEHPYHHATEVTDLLEIVEHEQHPLAAKMTSEHILRCNDTLAAGTNALCNRSQGEVTVADRCERDDEHPVRVVARDLANDLERQRRLTDSPDAGERDQPYTTAKHTHDGGDVVGAAHRLGERHQGCCSDARLAVHPRIGGLEALAEQDRQVVCDEFRQLVG